MILLIFEAFSKSLTLGAQPYMFSVKNIKTEADNNSNFGSENNSLFRHFAFKLKQLMRFDPRGEKSW